MSLLCGTSEENNESRLFIPILGLFILCYLFLGGLIFSQIEGQQEQRDLVDLATALDDLAVKHNISMDNLTAILMDYDDVTKKHGYTSSDLNSDHAHARKWTFLGAFVFSATVVTTMGFGIATPNSDGARMLFIAYSLIGCPAAFLFFNTCLVRFIEYFTAAVNCIRHRKRRRRLTRLRERPKPYIASPVHVIIALFSLTVIVLTVTSLIYTFTESGWDFVTSLYYCFTTFSTIGFGDIVSGQDHEYDSINRYLYHIIDGAMVTIGCCSVYALFNMTSLFVKKFIDCVVMRIKRLCCMTSSDSEGEKEEDESGGDNLDEEELNGGAIRIKVLQPKTVGHPLFWDDAQNRHVIEDSGISAGEPQSPTSKSSVRFTLPSRETQRRNSKRDTQRNGSKSRKSGRKSSGKKKLGARISRRNDTEPEIPTRQSISLETFKLREAKRRHSDPVQLAISSEIRRPQWERMAQSARDYDRHFRLSPKRRFTGWEESKDVFPLSIMRSKLQP